MHPQDIYQSFLSEINLVLQTGCSDRFLWHGGIQKCDIIAKVTKNYVLFRYLNAWFLWSSVFGYKRTEFWSVNCSGSDSVIFAFDSAWENTQTHNMRILHNYQKYCDLIGVVTICHCPWMENSYARVHIINHCHLELE